MQSFLWDGGQQLVLNNSAGSIADVVCWANGSLGALNPDNVSDLKYLIDGGAWDFGVVNSMDKFVGTGWKGGDGSGMMLTAPELSVVNEIAPGDDNWISSETGSGPGKYRNFTFNFTDNGLPANAYIHNWTVLLSYNATGDGVVDPTPAWPETLQYWNGTGWVTLINLATYGTARTWLNVTSAIAPTMAMLNSGNMAIRFGAGDIDSGDTLDLDYMYYHLNYSLYNISQVVNSSGIGQGNSIGRDMGSNDTNTRADWANDTGVAFYGGEDVKTDGMMTEGAVNFFVIPEYEELLMPVFSMTILFAFTRAKRKSSKKGQRSRTGKKDRGDMP
jgi:hypothetical protein